MAENCATSENSGQGGDCCCGPRNIGPLTYRTVPTAGSVDTSRGPVERVSSDWRLKDYLGLIGVRIGISRMNYAVKPGLYAIGNPNPGSPVIVTANYKLTFDVVRKTVKGLDLWLLVIDTKGVNVWCAAGKGTFGTMEIVKRVAATGLADIVTTKTLIVPQLGAPGVAAHMVKGFSEFNVKYGPVRISDLKRYLENGQRADAEMRRVKFTALDRLTVAWLELSMALKTGLLASAGIILLAVLLKSSFAFYLAFLWSSIIAGTILTALFLPYLPGKAFSVRGAIMGGLVGIALLAGNAALNGTSFSPFTSVSLVMAGCAISAYLALNFTGASTFTSLSGVKKEMRFALPAIIGAAAVAALLQIVRIIL